MTKPQITAIIMLLSQIEGWALAIKEPIPEEVGDSLERAFKALLEELLDE